MLVLNPTTRNNLSMRILPPAINQEASRQKPWRLASTRGMIPHVTN
jgi:hypothetical protein